MLRIVLISAARPNGCCRITARVPAWLPN